VDEEDLAGLQRGRHEDVRPDRAGDLRQGSCLNLVQPRGDRQHLPGRYDDLLGVPAAGEQRAHTITRAPFVDTFTDALDDA
jgi:hypothetical protein